MKRFFAAAACAAFLTGLTAGCGPAPAAEEASVEFYAMDTAMTVTAYGPGAEAAAEQAQSAVNRLESLLSRTREGSDISAVNSGAGAPVPVSGETAGLLNAAWSFSHATGGAFDVTIAPVADAWGFTQAQQHVPAQDALDALLDAVDYQSVLVEGGSAASAKVTLGAGQAIDLGGIAKGYASDQVAAVLAENNVGSAMAYLGGNVYVRGAKPDGTLWRIGVQDPQNAGGFAGILSLTDSFAITSGGYQRYFEQDGKPYHHIIDPKTGYPASSGLISVTVVAAGGEAAAGIPGSGTMCDAFSTALYVLGEEAAIDFWRAGAYAFEMVLVTGDGRVLVSEGLSDSFEQEADSGYTYETIGRAAP